LRLPLRSGATADFADVAGLRAAGYEIPNAAQVSNVVRGAERQTFDAVLGGWVLSDNESRRFDALALIDEYRIRRALPALEELRRRLDQSPAPGAPFEKAQVDRIIASLA